MNIRSFVQSLIYKISALVIAVAVISASVPQRGWYLLFTPTTAHAASNEKDMPARRSNSTGSPASQSLQDALPQEITGKLKDLRALNPNGQIDNALMDKGALLEIAQQQPESLVHPLAVSRVQSVYRAVDTIANTLVVTFTVTNNQSPALAPRVPASTTEEGDDYYHVVLWPAPWDSVHVLKRWEP